MRIYLGKSSFVMWLLVTICFSKQLKAGVVEITSSDNAVSYQPSGNDDVTSVLIGENVSVTLKTSSDNNAAVYSTYDLPDGAYIMSDNGWGTPMETATIGFTSDAQGTVNEIDVTVDHDNIDPGTPQCANGKKFVFHACIPQIDINEIRPSSIINSPSGYDFEVQPTVSGVDDFDQVEFRQEICSSHEQKLFNSQNFQPFGTGIYNTNGTYEVDEIQAGGGNLDWAPLGGGGNGHPSWAHDGYVASLDPKDEQTMSQSKIGKTVNGVDIFVVQEMRASLAFRLKIRRAADGTALDEDFDYSYSWNNANCVWGNNPTFAQYSAQTGYLSGAFYGHNPYIQGDPLTGQFTNPNGISLPTTHSP